MKRFLIALFVVLAWNSYSQGLQMNDSTRVVIKEMRVIGNKHVNDGVVIEESKIEIGDEYELFELAKVLNNCQRNLTNLRLFNEVEILIDKWTDDNEINLVFFVNERWYIYPVPVLELTGIDFNEWRTDYDLDLSRLTYGFELLHANLTNRGDVLKLKAKTGFQKNLGFSYNLDALDKERNWGVGFGFDYKNNKGAIVSAINNEYNSQILDQNVYKSKDAFFAITNRKNVTQRHTIGIGYSNYNIADTLQQLSPNFFADNSTRQEYGNISYSFVLEERNLIEYPTEGHNVQALLSYDGLLSNDLDLFSFSSTIGNYKQILPRHYLSGSLNTRYIPSNDIPFFNLSRLAISDMKMPRGYQAYRVFPKNYATLKTEYRYDLVTKRFRNIPILPDRFEPVPFRVLPKAFADFGFTSSNQYIENNELNDDFLYSFGLGVDVVTIYNSPFSFELSQNHLGELNFNIGLGKSF